jgi:hypothetical protein
MGWIERLRFGGRRTRGVVERFNGRTRVKQIVAESAPPCATELPAGYSSRVSVVRVSVFAPTGRPSAPASASIPLDRIRAAGRVL